MATKKSGAGGADRTPRLADLIAAHPKIIAAAVRQFTELGLSEADAKKAVAEGAQRIMLKILEQLAPGTFLDLATEQTVGWLCAFLKAKYGIDNEKAWDIANKSILRLGKVLAKGKPIHSPKAWLRRVADNLAIDDGRKETRRKKNCQSVDYIEAFADPRIDELAVDKKLDAIDFLVKLRKSNKAETVAMVEMYLATPDCTYDDVAAKFRQFTPEAVKKRIYRALRGLGGA